jgi:hypothetical protein
MPRRIEILVVLVALVAFPSLAPAARTSPPETRNAALRYWMAFAEMQDPPADKEIAELLEKTAAGETAWDEGRLGPILDKNDSAIQLMQRATELPDCDWGIEYGKGPVASIAFVPRARVLARLNTLYGMRLAAKGDRDKAVETWLTGIRFSENLAKGGTLIFALIAKTGLLSNMNALTQAAEAGSLSTADKAKIASTLRALPETGFDWGQALAYEQYAIAIGIQNMRSATNPDEYYQQLMGAPPPASVKAITASDANSFEMVMSSAEAAVRLSPLHTDQRLVVLQKSLDLLNPVYRQMIPSFTKVNDSRKQIAVAREKLLHLTTAN